MRSLRILYAEDDVDYAKNTAKTLELFFDEVICVYNGADALSEFYKQKTHIVILDYVMPILDGAKVASEIRKTDDKTPIFIVSAYTDKEKLLSVMGLNLVDYLEKPVSISAFKNVISKCQARISDYKAKHNNLSDGVTYDFYTKSVYIKDTIVRLSKNESKFIEILLDNKGQVISNNDIEKEVFNSNVEQNTLRNMVYRLRKKLKDYDVILTLKDVGYFIKHNDF